MFEERVSYRYAKALLEAVKQDNILDEIFRDLEFVEKIFKANKELQSLTRKPLISPFRMKNIFREIFANKISEFTLNFLLFLIDKSRHDLVISIVD